MDKSFIVLRFANSIEVVKFTMCWMLLTSEIDFVSEFHDETRDVHVFQWTNTFEHFLWMHPGKQFE